jgi:hypothetical protein
MIWGTRPASGDHLSPRSESQMYGTVLDSCRLPIGTSASGLISLETRIVRWNAKCSFRAVMPQLLGRT